MKTLYIDCGMGAAGDMLTAALFELLSDDEKKLFLEKINSLGIPGVSVQAEKTQKCGIAGTHISVMVNGEEEGDEYYTEHHHHPATSEFKSEEHHHHHHASLHHIEEIVSSLDVSDKVKEDVESIYQTIADAESKVHGVPVTEIHFHEVGTMDAVADITAVCFLMEMLSPEKIIASPVHVGSGHVQCAHGILPVPAPATALILKDVPIYGGKIDGELCTPTGAALLTHFVSDFGDLPVIKTEKIGYGMGKKDFEVANCVRVLLGETSDYEDTVTELTCNIDDMTPEEVGFATQQLFKAGALDVYSVNCGMKKNRPGIILSILCKNSKKDKMIQTIFKYTTTIGIRENVSRRYTLDRETNTVRTPWGDVRKKISSGYGILREKLEYDDISKIAEENGLSLDEVKKQIK